MLAPFISPDSSFQIRMVEEEKGEERVGKKDLCVACNDCMLLAIQRLYRALSWTIEGRRLERYIGVRPFIIL